MCLAKDLLYRSGAFQAMRCSSTVADEATAQASIATAQASIALRMPKRKKGESVIIRGQVLDPDGHPFAGARIVLAVPEYLQRASSRSLTKSDASTRRSA